MNVNDRPTGPPPVMARCTDCGVTYSVACDCSRVDTGRGVVVLHEAGRCTAQHLCPSPSARRPLP